VDIVAQKSGFLPQRITGVVLSGNITQAFTLTDDFNYEAGTWIGIHDRCVVEPRGQ
jgi:hypothetical protein